MNLLDESYFPSADDKAQEAPGRTFGLFVTWTGG
jgi:outer membrane receptor protein involved in Fe transport